MSSEALLHEGSQVQPPVVNVEYPVIHLGLLLEDVLVLGQPESVSSPSNLKLPDSLGHLDLSFKRNWK